MNPTSNEKLILYLDCPGGVSGDMLLAALCDGFADVGELLGELRECMDFFGDVELRAESLEKYGLRGRQLKINYSGEAERPCRDFRTVREMLDESTLPEAVKGSALEVFRRIAEAEGKIHGMPPDEVHFHEISSADTLVDVVGFAFAICKLGIDEVYCSPLPLGNGTVKFSHGVWPVPAPATVELLGNAPVYKTDVLGELVTPTGAALVTQYAKGFGRSPQFRVKGMGQGIGTLDRPERPNVIRAMVGVMEVVADGEEEIVELVTAVDDVSGVVVGHALELIRSKGVLDAYTVPATMKKGRPGLEIHVLVKPDQADEVCDMLFKETSTLGIRRYRVMRSVRERSTEVREVSGEEVTVKVVSRDEGESEVRPEYESLREIAAKRGAPLREVDADIRERLQE